jgi:hypothetical protein
VRTYRGLLLALLSFSATAGTISIGFESPDYSVGSITGQQGWSKSGNYDAQVTSADAYDGGQSLRISNGIASYSFGDQTFTPHLDVPAGESGVPGAVNTFLASWYFKSVTGQLQDGLGISVSADNGAGARMTYLRMGDDSVNGMNLQFVDFGGSPEDFVYHWVATNLDRSVWHRIDMAVYFLEGPGNDIVRISLDGQLLVTGTTWEDYSRSYTLPDGSPGPLPPVNSLLFRAGGTSVPSVLGQGFYIDDVNLESLNTPEPGTVGLVLAGVIGLLLRRIPKS